MRHASSQSAWLLLPQYFKGEILSAYQVLQQRFDARVQRTASGLFLFTRSIADGLRLYLTALLLHLFTGWSEVQRAMPGCCRPRAKSCLIFLLSALPAAICSTWRSPRLPISSSGLRCISSEPTWR